MWLRLTLLNESVGVFYFGSGGVVHFYEEVDEVDGEIESYTVLEFPTGGKDYVKESVEQILDMLRTSEIVKG